MCANIFQIVVGFVIAEKFHGRRTAFIQYGLIVLMVSDTLLFVTRIATDPDIDDDEPYADLDSFWTTLFFCISSSVTYMEYFLICMLGIVDFAKKEQLFNNNNQVAMLICFVFFFEGFTNACFIRRIVFWANNNFIAWFLVDTAATITAFKYL